MYYSIKENEESTNENDLLKMKVNELTSGVSNLKEVVKKFTESKRSFKNMTIKNYLPS